MNCEQARELAALAASGDLTPMELSTLESHTADCSECGAEAAAFEELCGQLSAMREDAPGHVYSAVRARVAAEILDRNRSRWFAMWPVFAAVVTCALVLAIVLLRRESPQVERPSPPASVEVAAAQIAPPDVFAPWPKRRVRRTAARVATPVPDEPLVVHMFTDDPDVVIYWIADARGKRSEKEIIQ
jgi:hypothetical protein